MDSIYQDEEKYKTFKTEGGKTLTIRPDSRYCMYEVFFKEGGEVPPSLTGRFTDPETAYTNIRNYFADLAKVPPQTERKLKSTTFKKEYDKSDLAKSRAHNKEQSIKKKQ
jgi:hypothetical protein